MYTRQEASRTKQEFWTRFGQYMRPITSASGESVNWLNYKSGVKHLFFRMDADTKHASIAIELHHSDAVIRLEFYNRLEILRTYLESITGETWTWEPEVTDESGKTISRIGTQIPHVNVMDTATWPTIISFLKPRLIALDRFWTDARDHFM